MPPRYEIAFASLAVGFVLVCCKPPVIEEYLHDERIKSNHGGETETIVLVTVDGDPITLADVERRMRGLSSTGQASLDSPAARRRLLHGLVLVEVLAREAEAQGLANDTMVEFLTKRALADVVLDRMVAEDSPRFEPTEEIVQAHYEENRTRFVRPHEFRLLVLVTATREEAATVRDRLLGQEGDGSLADEQTHFVQLVAEHSIDEPSKARSGDLGYLSRETVANAFGEEIAEQLFLSENVGLLYGPVRCRNGWSLLYSIREHRAYEVTLEEATAEIRRELIDEHLAELRASLLAGLRTDGEVTHDESSLAILRDPGLPHRPGRGTDLRSLTDEEIESLLNPHLDATELVAQFAWEPVHENEGTGDGVDND